MENILQKTEAWHRRRLGRFTASKAYVFMANSKTAGEPNATAKTYILGQLWELISGTHEEIKAWQLEWGNEWEVWAKKMVQDKYKSEFFDLEFIEHATLPYIGGSPDGNISINGMEVTVECKCPVGKDHLLNIKNFKSAELVKKNYPELYWQLQLNTLLDKTHMGLAVSFHHEAGDLMYADIMLPRNDEDISLMLTKMAEGWEWMKKEAAEYGIDILAKYEEFKKPVGLQPISEAEAYNYDNAA